MYSGGVIDFISSQSVVVYLRGSDTVKCLEVFKLFGRMWCRMLKHLDDSNL